MRLVGMAGEDEDEDEDEEGAEPVKARPVRARCWKVDTTIGQELPLLAVCTSTAHEDLIMPWRITTRTTQ